MEWVIERLISLLGSIANLSTEKRELADRALTAVADALNETYLYYRDLPKKGRDLDIEGELVKAWRNAAIPLRHIDAELARGCEHKSEYWLNPEGWDDQAIIDAGIRLADVRDRYRKLLNEK